MFRVEGSTSNFLCLGISQLAPQYLCKSISAAMDFDFNEKSRNKGHLVPLCGPRPELRSAA